MPVELRKRKAPAEPAAPPPAKKKTSAIKNAASKVKAAVTGSKANGTASAPTVDSTISLEGFGGEVETQDGVKTTLAKLVADSKNGVVLFTYPKASTPGCTKQACLFRDEFTPLTATGFDIYGLSRDSPKANTTFKQKQNLPYALLCDPSANLIGAIGLKKAPSSTIRGVFVVDKAGKVLISEAGSPDGTVKVVKELVTNATPVEPAAATSAEPAPAPVAAPPAAAEPEKVEAEKPATEAPAIPKEPEAPAPVVASAAPAEVEKKPEPAAPVVPVVSAAETTTANGAPKEGDAEIAKTAAEVADSAAKVDPATPNPA